MPNDTVLVTGAAGFIGFHVAGRLLSDGRTVIGIDNINDYYDPRLKEARLDLLKADPRFTFVKLDLADRAATKSLFERHRFPAVVYLAAQAGVRYSIQNPHAYIDANIEGFINVLEGCRHNDCGHLLFASSSSVYGANTKLPFSVQDNVDHPISLYAASKKANELMAHAYSHLYRIPATGLRGSRTTDMTGYAVVEAARDLKRQIVEKGLPTGDNVLIASASPNPNSEGKVRKAFGAHFVEGEVV